MSIVMRVLFAIPLIFGAMSVFGQSTFTSTAAGGDWTSASTWTCSGTCATSFPSTGDRAIIAVTDDGFVSVPNDYAVTLSNLVFYSDVPADALRKGGGDPFGAPPVFTITGFLASYNRGGTTPTAQTNASIENSFDGPIQFIFTGVGTSILIQGWGINAPIPNVTFALPAATTRSTHSFAVAETGLATISSGTLNLASGHYIADPTSSASILVNGTGTLRISGSISGDGTANTNFYSVIVNNQASVQAGAFLNASNLTVGTGGRLTIVANTTTNNTGWYRTTPPDGEVDLSAGTVIYSGTNQTVISTTYGALTLSTSASTKTTTADALRVEGILTISSGVVLNSDPSTSVVLLGNISNAGTWAPADIVEFEGASQVIAGTSIPFNGGVQIGDPVTVPATTIQLSANMDVNGPLSVYTNAQLNPAGFTVNIAGNLTVTGTINSTNTSSTLAFDGVTAINSTSTLPSVTVSGTVTAPNASLTLNGNLTITGTGTYNAGTILNLAGNFTSNGTFNANSGTVVFNGTVNQSIGGTSPTTFRNMTISNVNPDIVSIESAQNLTGVLTLSANSWFDADGLGAGNNIFTMLSSDDEPTVDAAIAAIPSTATLNGRVTIQRHMDIEGAFEGRVYRYISSPVVGGTIADMQQEIPITGSFTGNNNATIGSTNASLFYYNEAVTTDVNGSGANDINDGWVAYPTSTNAETFASARGYSIFVRGNLLSTAKWDLRGTIVNASNSVINFNPSFTSSGNLANDGWNLVGNPFPSAIDWNAAGWTKSGLDGSTYIIDNTGTATTYGNTVTRSWNGTTGTNGGSRYIAIGQAFYVKATGPNPALTAFETVKAPGTVTNFFRAAPLTNILRATLVQAGGSRDDMVVHFREDASPEFDSHADTWKIPNTQVNIFSLAGTNKFAINSREALSCQTEVTLGISQVKAGSYSLEFSEFESFDNQVAITLIDKFTNTTHNARTGNYEFSVTADPASHGHSRFVIRFERAIDSTLSIAAPAVCGDQAATIIIESAQVGVKYFVQKNGMAISDTLEGNGDNLSLQIASEHLLAGENTLVVISYLPCSQVERSVIVQVGATPIITSTTPGQTCGSGTVTLEAVASSPEALFNWYDSESATEPVSSNSSGIFATPALQKSRMYYVSAVAAQGCEGERVGVLASVINLTPVTIVQQGNFLVSNYTAGNQWYLNGAALANETQQRLKAKDDGLYSVEVTTQNCKTSAEFEVTGNKNHASELSSLRVFPNPVVDIMILEYEDASEIKSMKLTNSMGREVAGFELKWDENSSRTEIDLKSLDPGIYILKVYGVDKTRTFKVIKK